MSHDVGGAVHVCHMMWVGLCMSHDVGGATFVT